MLYHFFCEEEGQTLVEYGLIIAFIAMVVIATMALFGVKISDYFGAANNKLPNN